MSTLSYGEVNDEVLGALAPPRRSYYVVLALLAAAVAWALSCWIYQVRTGMKVTGLNHPVGWATYITNFVFWVGMAHSGTLISAILHLVRSKWRNAVSRSAEAMTIFAIMTAGLFPLVHLGRVWVFYYIIPYPSERQLWPDFTSPLVWDIVAITTYLTVSVIFFFVGLLPDLAAARDRCELALGPDHPRSMFYRRLAIGWSGAASQWRHYGRAYLFFAALATPLVVSVHSVVSWDFAMSLLPGWHTTIFAPYFVAGAIHSGLAMVLTLMIPLRRLLNLKKLITDDHLGAVALTMIVTTLIVGYAYIIEPFIAWYSGDPFERQFAVWRATGWLSWAYWMLVPLNVLFPLAFVFKAVRRNIKALFVISILVNVGMWFERFMIIVGSTSHDFLPHNWGQYAPTWVELSITGGALAFFLLWFFGFSKLLPVVPASEIKEEQAERQIEGFGKVIAGRQSSGGTKKLLAVFSSAGELLEAARKSIASSLQVVDAYSPVKLEPLNSLLYRRPSPVRYWALAGALGGLIGGFWLAIGSANVNNLIVGGKPPVAIIPFCIVGFEGTVLIGAIVNLIGLLIHARLVRRALPAVYDRRFSRDKFGLLVACEPSRLDEVRSLMSGLKAEEVHVAD